MTNVETKFKKFKKIATLSERRFKNLARKQKSLATPAI